MISAIKRLMAGDKTVAAKFIAAQEFWKNIFDAHRNADVKVLTDALGEKQQRFESALGMDRALSKEIMPYTCIAYLYDEQSGFGDNRPLARSILSAFEQSDCSREVHTSAKRAAHLFGLEQEEQGGRL
jgi:hypothetical protein